MEIKEFIQNFADQFDDTDASVFTSETKFKELEEWSSLTALSVIGFSGIQECTDLRYLSWSSETYRVQ